jgi:hypothetical protein
MIGPLRYRATWHRSATIYASAATMNIRFCCRPFKEQINRAGQRGSAIVVSRNGQNPLKFRLQSRGVAHENEEEAKKISTQIIVSIWTQQTIEYCPYCGRRPQELSVRPFLQYWRLHGCFVCFSSRCGESRKNDQKSFRYWEAATGFSGSYR